MGVPIMKDIQTLIKLHKMHFHLILTSYLDSTSTPPPATQRGLDTRIQLCRLLSVDSLSADVILDGGNQSSLRTAVAVGGSLVKA